MVANQQGREDIAKRLRSLGDGQSPQSTAATLRSMKLPFRQTTRGELAFLNRVTRERLGCIVSHTTYGDGRSGHVIYFDRFAKRNGGTFAVLVDNNFPADEVWIESGKFLSTWRRSGGWAATLELPGGGMVWPN